MDKWRGNQSSIRRVAKHREGELGMPASSVKEMVRIFNRAVGLALRLVTVPVTITFTLKVRRPDGMDETTVGMPFFPVLVIRFGMHVNEGNRQHPEPDPREHHQAKEMFVPEPRSHDEDTIPPLGIRGNRVPHRSTLRNRSAFVMTETELNVMAALANMGLSSNPTNGYRTPAATGTPTML